MSARSRLRDTPRATPRSQARATNSPRPSLSAINQASISRTATRSSRLGGADDRSTESLYWPGQCRSASRSIRTSQGLTFAAPNSVLTFFWTKDLPFRPRWVETACPLLSSHGSATRSSRRPSTKIPYGWATAGCSPPSGLARSRRKRKTSSRLLLPLAFGPTRNARRRNTSLAALKLRQFSISSCVKRSGSTARRAAGRLALLFRHRHSLRLVCLPSRHPTRRPAAPESPACPHGWPARSRLPSPSRRSAGRRAGSRC